MARNSTVVLLALVTMSAWLVKETVADCPNLTSLEVCEAAAVADVQPSEACCTALATYISTNGVACLCEAAIASLYFLTHPTDYAITIPEKCGIVYPAGSQCAGKSTSLTANYL